MNAESIFLSEKIIQENKLTGTEIAVLLYLDADYTSVVRTARGIARAFNKDRRNISRTLQALEKRGFLFRHYEQWFLSPENVVSFSHAGAKS